jgi:ribonucleotide reductase beta subunit family protein with ferritin-like domain
VEAKFWGAEEIKLTDDADDWASGKLSKMDRNIVNRCLTLFASEPALLGGDITETMVQTFSEEVQTLEARCMYGYMMQARNIYQELFALCLQEFSHDHEERKQFFIDARDNSRFFKERANCTKSAKFEAHGRMGQKVCVG